ncbi:hypothetical protein AB1Y20_017046 [Prymnesium parvum]|uniref:Magnesium transporter n=1 Tax=Prymnesium parvum TaxID=97485 RepID=A0AB34I7S8_PRYPA
MLGNSSNVDVADKIADQLLGSVLEMTGVAITVVGLHGMKVHGVLGRALSCSKSATWYAYVGLWALGQLIQLLAVEFATEPVIASVSNFAIVCNAVLAHYVLGERITRLDAIAIAVMIGGALLVVSFVPEPTTTSLQLAELRALFVASAAPLVGLLGTTLLAAAAIPAAVRSALHPELRTAPHGGIAFGVLAGYAGAISITTSKICWLVFDAISFASLAQPLWWFYAVCSFAGELLMVAALFNGMSWHEASIVVSTYYISMTICGALQGLCIFGLIDTFRAASAAAFAFGIALCVGAVYMLALSRAVHAADEASLTAAAPPRCEWWRAWCGRPRRASGPEPLTAPLPMVEAAVAPSSSGGKPGEQPQGLGGSHHLHPIVQ